MQPVLVFEATAEKLRTVRERAERHGVPIALDTMDVFATGHNAANRAAVRRAVAAAELGLVGIAHRDAGPVLRGLSRHPW